MWMHRLICTFVVRIWLKQVWANSWERGHWHVWFVIFQTPICSHSKVSEMWVIVWDFLQYPIFIFLIFIKVWTQWVTCKVRDTHVTLLGSHCIHTLMDSLKYEHNESCANQVMPKWHHDNFERDPLHTYFDKCQKNEIYLLYSHFYWYIVFVHKLWNFTANLVKYVTKKSYEPLCLVITLNSRLYDVTSIERYVDQSTLLFIGDVA